MMESLISLPWPLKGLSPNARGHWTKRATATKVYRQACYVLTWQAIRGNAAKFKNAPIAVSITFSPPDNRPRDLDNLIASIKAGLDGVAAAIGVDDAHFQITAKKSAKAARACVSVAICQ